MYIYMAVPIAAGGRISAIWDGKVVSNACWSVKDAAAGTNHKVYQCLDALNNVDFCVSVDDNQDHYSLIQLWEDWDNVGHVGVGDTLSGVPYPAATYPIKAYASGGTHLCYNDHRVMWGTSIYYQMNYIGELKRFDTTKDMPVLIASTGGNLYNPLGFSYNQDGNVCMACLWDQNGAVGQDLRMFAYNSGYKYHRTCNGSWFFYETTIHDDTSPYVAMGYLDGVCSMYNAANGFANGITPQCGDARWLILGGNYSTKYWAAMRLT